MGLIFKVISVWSMHIYSMGQHSVQIDSVNIHLVNSPPPQSGQANDKAQAIISSHRTVHVIIVESVDLGKASSDQASFIPDQIALCVVFLGEDPTRVNNRLALRQLDLIPCIFGR